MSDNKIIKTFAFTSEGEQIPATIDTATGNVTLERPVPEFGKDGKTRVRWSISFETSINEGGESDE